MALDTPTPEPPRTPTPPSEDEHYEAAGLGLDGVGDLLSLTQDLYDPRALSPMTENFAVTHYNSGASLSISNQPLNPTSPNSLYSSFSAESNGSHSGISIQNGKGPFNFQPMSLAKSPITKSVNTFSCREVDLLLNVNDCTECWSTTRSQIQAQLRLSPNLCRASTTASNRASKLPTYTHL